MPAMEGIGKVLVITGLTLSALGMLILFGGKLGLGRLPGDIFFKKGNFSFYFPLVSSILLSILLTVLLNIFKRR